MNKNLKRRANLLYRLRKKGFKCVTKERMVFFPYGEKDPFTIKQIAELCSEYHFKVQLELQ